MEHSGTARHLQAGSREMVQPKSQTWVDRSLARHVFFCFPALCTALWAALGHLKFFFFQMMLLGSRPCNQSSTELMLGFPPQLLETRVVSVGHRVQVNAVELGAHILIQQVAKLIGRNEQAGVIETFLLFLAPEKTQQCRNHTSLPSCPFCCSLCCLHHPDQHCDPPRLKHPLKWPRLPQVWRTPALPGFPGPPVRHPGHDVLTGLGVLVLQSAFSSLLLLLRVVDEVKVILPNHHFHKCRPSFQTHFNPHLQCFYRLNSVFVSV